MHQHFSRLADLAPVSAVVVFAASALTSEKWLAFATPMAVIVAAIVQKLDSRKVHKALEAETSKRNDKLDEIHSLVNGAMTEQKRLAMAQSQRIAHLTQDPRDIVLAEAARKAFIDHEEQTTRVDIAIAKGQEKE